MFWRKPKEHPDYNRIIQLEIELGFVEPSPTLAATSDDHLHAVGQLVNTAYARFTSYAAPNRVEVLTSTDPERPVLKMIWNGEG